MAYSGFLIKIGNYTVPFNFIEAGSYKAVIHGQDLDSFTNANGVTNRNALKNVKPIVEFDIPAPITERELRPLLNGIQSNYINSTEKSVNVTAFYPEYAKYYTMKFYEPDFEIVIDTVDESEITYKSAHVKFVAYGGALNG